MYLHEYVFKQRPIKVHGPAKIFSQRSLENLKAVRKYIMTYIWKNSILYEFTFCRNIYFDIKFESSWDLLLKLLSVLLTTVLINRPRYHSAHSIIQLQKVKLSRHKYNWEKIFDFQNRMKFFIEHPLCNLFSICTKKTM